jgi:hypothetical protein
MDSPAADASRAQQPLLLPLIPDYCKLRTRRFVISVDIIHLGMTDHERAKRKRQIDAARY